jgi:hypothetical protein
MSRDNDGFSTVVGCEDGSAQADSPSLARDPLDSTRLLPDVPRTPDELGQCGQGLVEAHESWQRHDLPPSWLDSAVAVLNFAKDIQSIVSKSQTAVGSGAQGCHVNEVNLP